MSLYLAILLLLLPTAILAVCNDGDFYHDGYCYFIPSFTDGYGMTHSEGQAYCRQRGANLPALHSQEQDDFNVMMSIRVFGKGTSWIGLNRPGMWDDGSAVDFLNWEQGYPKNVSHCVMEYYNHNNNNEGSWRDTYDCTYKSKFFCQYKTSTTCTCCGVPGCTCCTMEHSCNWYNLAVGNRCYLFFNQAATRSDAAFMCQSYGQSLATFDNLYQDTQVQTIAKTTFQTSSYFWIGLHLNSADSKYYWPGNVPLTFNNWGGNSPNNNYPSVVQSVSNGLWWNSGSEQLTYPFVCSGMCEGKC